MFKIQKRKSKKIKNKLRLFNTNYKKWKYRSKNLKEINQKNNFSS